MAAPSNRWLWSLGTQVETYISVHVAFSRFTFKFSPIQRPRPTLPFTCFCSRGVARVVLRLSRFSLGYVDKIYYNRGSAVRGWLENLTLTLSAVKFKLDNRFHRPLASQFEQSFTLPVACVAICGWLENRTLAAQFGFCLYTVCVH